MRSGVRKNGSRSGERAQDMSDHNRSRSILGVAGVAGVDGVLEVVDGALEKLWVAGDTAGLLAHLPVAADDPRLEGWRICAPFRVRRRSSHNGAR
eukprot:11965260-Alexandrium_andersonii.AAC.1